MDDSRPVVAYVASLELMKVSSLLPSNRQRSALVHNLARSLGLYARKDASKRILALVSPQAATRAELSVYHTDEYLDFVLNPDADDDASKSELGLEDDCPLFKGVGDYVALIGGAAITAVKKLQHPRCEVAIVWDGGRHHAQKARAAGFCYVADCTLAIMSLRRIPQPISSGGHRKPRIMYLDLDLHFSDGVSHAFHQTSSQLLTLSIHHAAPGFFPSSPLAHLPTPESDPFTLSLLLHQGAANSTFLRAWRCVELIHSVFDPDYLILQCGVDGLAGDPCAIFNWSLGPAESEAGSLGWCLSRALSWRGKKLLLGGGGYHSANAARAYAYLTSIAIGAPLPLDTHIPEHEYFPEYAPSFTLDVPPGTMQDRNTDAYLCEVEAAFAVAAEKITARMQPQN
ncbi:Hist-deacetyl domain-containing protein [Mycena kentingensis (nom. inval.)]|nr:Hist-deacetyl domain-containing protein [Mycena kentingensis (nom. inval.)]